MRGQGASHRRQLLARPATDFPTTLQAAQQENKRVVLWDYALDPEIYQRAELTFNPAWLESLGKAQSEARNAGGAYLRRFANLVVYPTLTLQAGEVQTFTAKP